jgi:hypothetical protein
MKGDKNNRSFFGEGMRVVVSCPLCNAKYEPEEASLVHESEGGYLFHVDCRRCGSSILAAVISGKMGLNSIGLVTDLTRADVKKLAQARRVSDDDIIATHQFLKKHRGSLAEVLVEKG